jgi:RNA polymerase sigma factor (sigma-70 family)
VQGGTVWLLDENGRRVEAHIERVVMQLRVRLVRHFPSCRDEAVALDVLEEAARRLARRERRRGPIEKLHGYAWVTLRTVMMSRLRRGEGRVTGQSVASERGAILLARRCATFCTAADVERRVLIGQLLARLTPTERRVCTMKAAGYSTREIGGALGRSAMAIDTLYSRAKAKAREKGKGGARVRACGTDCRVRAAGAQKSRPDAGSDRAETDDERGA